ncbi:MAG: IS1595 family transposase [Acidobacteriia bacterium]|nr:IS1595 family transposase [Terriglobia bacterium]
MKDRKQPRTLQEAIRYFGDPDNALAYVVERIWPDGTVTCPTCGRADVVFLKNQRKWQCKSVHPKRQFSAKVGTIFEDSPIPLDKWMTAVWMLVNCRNGVSSYEVARTIGVTQKSAWFMLHRIRKALQNKSFRKLGGSGGSCEADETFIGAKARNVHVGKRDAKVGMGKKAIIVGVLERGGHVRAEVVETRKRHKIHEIVKENVLPGSALYTDKLLSYKGLENYFAHEVVDHALGYVRGQVHTNGLENFWSLLKRGLGGTYVNVEPFHLFRYLDEQMFRYNNRRDADRVPLPDSERFNLALSGILGKRLTYAELTGKDGATQPPAAS